MNKTQKSGAEKRKLKAEKELVTGLIKKLCRFENILLLVLWKSVLTKFNFVNKALQKSNLTLSVTKKTLRFNSHRS